MAEVLNNISRIEQFIAEKSDTTYSGTTNNDQKKALLLHMAGKEVKDIYRFLNSANVEENFYVTIGKLDLHFIPKKNISYERYCSKRIRQLSTEDSTTYISRLRALADSCKYFEMENEIRDHYFVATCRSNKLQKTLLREQNLTLTELQEISRNEETANRQKAQ